MDVDLRLLDGHVLQGVTAPLSKIRPFNIIASRRENPAIFIDDETACADGILSLRLTMVKVRDLNAGYAICINDQLAIGFVQHVADEDINVGHSENTLLVPWVEETSRHSFIVARQYSFCTLQGPAPYR